MCGFLGAFDRNGNVAPEHLSRALAGLRHRGPDDEGYLFSADGHEALSYRGAETHRDLDLPSLRSAPSGCRLGLGFRRLAIQDTSVAGHQPMASKNGRYWLAFNGELYNHWRVRPELERLGHAFTSGCDTETLLAAWSEWGPDCLDRFEGMWGFVLWDREARTLHLVRDRFGIKPLYWTKIPEGIAFGSEIAPTLTLAERSARARPGPLFRYLRFGWTDDGTETLFDGIERVEAGTHLQVALEDLSMTVTRYWSYPGNDVGPAGGISAEELQERFLASVDDHLLASVPVGVALSGGIDSSAVIAGVRRARGEEGQIDAFGHVADDPLLGEEAWIDQASAASGARVHKVRPTAEALGQDLEALVRLQGEPFGSTSIYAQHRVYGLAREHDIPVVLSGQGADELLGGYLSYLGPRLATLLSRGEWKRASRFQHAARQLPSVDARGLWLRAGAAVLPPSLAPMARRLAGESLTPPWIDADWFRDRGVPLTERPIEKDARGHLGSRLRQAFLETSLPALLRYEDRNSMARSVESRVPFLQRPLVEALAHAPESALIDDEATTKALFRRAMRGVVPDPILDRRDKVGFATPEAAWLRQLAPTVEKWLASDAADRVDGLRAGPLLLEWERIRAGRAAFDFRVWRGINVVAWADAFDVSFD